MSEEHRHLLEKAARARLTTGGGNADDDVSQHRSCEISMLSLLHREGEDVGRLVLPTIGFVQIMDCSSIS